MNICLNTRHNLFVGEYHVSQSGKMHETFLFINYTCTSIQVLYDCLI